MLPFRGGIRSNHWFYSLYVSDSCPLNQRQMIDGLKEHKIQTRPIWGLIHEQKPYEGSYTYEIVKAKDYWKHVVNLPCSTNLTEEDVDIVINAINEIVK